MGLGVIGLGENGRLAVASLLQKTAWNLFVYDPDGRGCGGAVTVCETAAELCEKCDVIVTALDRESDLTALCNGLNGFLREGQLIIDLTDTSPAFAHMIANGMRRTGVGFIDCGLFGADGLAGDFLLFAGGSSEAFADALPVLRCFAPDCRYLGAAGRGKAARLFCGALADRLQGAVSDILDLSDSFGIDRRDFLGALGGFEAVADPLAVLRGDPPAFPPATLAGDAALARAIERRAADTEDA